MTMIMAILNTTNGGIQMDYRMIEEVSNKADRFVELLDEQRKAIQEIQDIFNQYIYECEKNLEELDKRIQEDKGAPF